VKEMVKLETKRSKRKLTKEPKGGSKEPRRFLGDSQEIPRRFLGDS
jgi:hypothetical protein